MSKTIQAPAQGLASDYLFKIAILLRMELDGEALNNEDRIGNSTKSRVIQLRDGSTRNAISGDMIKHTFTNNARMFFDNEELCETCRVFSPMKNGKIEIDKNLSVSGNRVKNCGLEDLAGFANLGNGYNEKRISPIQMSWAIAYEGVRDDAVLHSRVDPSEKNNKKKIKGNTTSDMNTIEEQNTQMLFYRPIRSSEYALTLAADLHRIGFDDERLEYVLDKEVIKRRIRNMLKAVQNTILNPEGALCSTSLPHLGKVYGVINAKTNRNQILTKYSALNDDFIEVNARLSEDHKEFQSIEEFVAVLNSYMDEEFLDQIVERNMEYVKRFKK